MMDDVTPLRLDVDLAPFNSYGLRARCARAFFPNSEEDVRAIFESYPDTKKFLIGSGHNIILARDWYEEDFVIFNGNFSAVRVSGSIMEAQAGAFSKRMSEIALSHSLSGLEVFYDIPSSLGGAVVMNAGAGGEEIMSLVETVRYLDCDTLQVIEAPGSELAFSYRDSMFQRDPRKIVLGARLRLAEGNPIEIRQKMYAIREQRWSKQPRDHPNAGSVFKRPQGRFVGPMIEALRLKGASVGGVHVSEKHAGFIVRHADASGSDLLALIDHVRRRVREEYDVELEIEQRVIL